MRVRDVLYYEAGVAARPLPRFGRCAPLVSTAALQPSFNGSLRLPSFSRGLRPLVSTQPYGCWLDSVDSLLVGSIQANLGSIQANLQANL